MAREREAARIEGGTSVAERLQPYVEVTRAVEADAPLLVDALPDLEELVARATTFLAVMPPRPRRETIEGLICPGNAERGRRVVDALIESSRVAVDERGCLRLLR
ncbi:MAG TPA: hypothetical protein VMN35_06535 [Gaiellaceae bacterium]|nr:hypothetical protein [Gaiellaceae bacterium]